MTPSCNAFKGKITLDYTTTDIITNFQFDWFHINGR